MVVLYLFTILLLAIYEGSKYGSLGSSKVDLAFSNLYEYNTNNGLPLMAVIYFYLDTAIPKANVYLRVYPDKHPTLKPQIPNNFNDFEKEDKDFFDWYLCNHAKLYY